MGLKKRSQQNEKERLKRVRVGLSKDLRGIISINGNSFPCTIEDYNFASIKLDLSTIPNNKFEKLKIDTFQLLYGSKILLTINDPEVIRHEPDRHVILHFNQKKSKVRFIREKTRLWVKPNFTPTVLVKDPLKLDNMLSLNVLNLTRNGLLLSTSLSNKHLVPGLYIESAAILLPGVKIINIDFKIQNSERQDNHLLFGVSIKRISDEDLEALAQFALFATVSPELKGTKSKLTSIRDNVTKIRNLASAIRCETVSSQEDFDKVLAVRFEAYKKAEKLSDALTVEDMKDEFDHRSIILMATMDGEVIGTIRFVESKSEDEKFPFEKYFQFKQVLPKHSRLQIYEVSKLAISPRYQGTDIITRLVKEGIRITLMNEKAGVCLAGKAPRRIYKAIGFREISSEVPHPVKADETLVLLIGEAHSLMDTRAMSSHMINKIGKEIADHLIEADVASVAHLKSKSLLRGFYSYLMKISILAFYHLMYKFKRIK